MKSKNSRDEQLDKKQSYGLSKLKNRKMFAEYAIRVFSDGMRTLDNRASDLMERNRKSIVVDLGTGDGKLLKNFNGKIKSKSLFALDILNIRKQKIKYVKTNLEKKFPIRDDFADVVISSQNIEHIIDIPNYCNEIARILKPGGYAIILTENLASWSNIACLMMGYIPFSMTNMFGLPYGNPFIWHRDFHTKEEYEEIYRLKQWGVLGHQRILTLR